VRVLLIANNFDGFLDLALRSQSAGHDVKCFARKYDRQTRPVGRGLVELVPEWRPWMLWADLVLLEDNGVFMAEMDSWRRRGARIVGGNDRSCAWEIERTVGMAAFRKAGIALPDYREFSDYDSAIAYVKKHDSPFVSKPCGAVDDKSLSYVAKSPDDLVYMLGRWKRKHGRPPCPFMLQEKISGVEFAVGAWFGPAGFAPGWEENFEFKKLCAGDLGPNTGEQGTVMRYTRESKLARQVLAPLEDQLHRLGYVGNVDVNCIVDEQGAPWPLEFTMRFGWPAFQIETALFTVDPIEYLYGVAEGRPPRGAHRMDTIAVGVVMEIPPYPHPVRNYDDVVGIPVWGLDPDNLGEFHPCELAASDFRMRKKPNGSEKSSNSSGKSTQTEALAISAGDYVLVSVGLGATVRAASSAAQKSLKKLSIPANPYWRNDIGLRLKSELPILQGFGYAKAIRYSS
jgi:phosphoribosylamine---glycine ligase